MESTPFMELAQYASSLPLQFLQRAEKHTMRRWIGTVIIFIIYNVRFFKISGFGMVNNFLFLYYMNLLVGFLSPRSDRPPTFPWRLPDYEFWYSFTVATFVAFLMTFFKVFDVKEPWLVEIGRWFIFGALYCLHTKRCIMRCLTFKQSPSYAPTTPIPPNAPTTQIYRSHEHRNWVEILAFKAR